MKTLIEALDKVCSNPQWFRLSEEVKAELKKITKSEQKSRDAGFQFGGILVMDD